MTGDDIERLARTRLTPLPARPPVLEGNPGSGGEWSLGAADPEQYERGPKPWHGDRTDPE